MINYLPYIKDTLGNRWEVLSIHFCVDFGGRQAQIEVQNMETSEVRGITYYYLSNLFLENKGEIALVKDILCQHLENIFMSFDKTIKGA